MAACDMCEQEEAAFIVGDVSTGDQKFLGPGCFARFGLEFAKNVLPGEEVAAQLGPMFVADMIAPEAAPPEAPKRAKGKKTQAEGPAEEGPAGGTAEESAASSDG